MNRRAFLGAFAAMSAAPALPARRVVSGLPLYWVPADDWLRRQPLPMLSGPLRYGEIGIVDGFRFITTSLKS